MCIKANENILKETREQAKLSGTGGTRLDQPLSPRCHRYMTFLRILFVFLSYNFSRGFPQATWKGASLMNGAVSFSRITFPCRVCHFVFGKRRRMTVFSHITFRYCTATFYPNEGHLSTT